MSRIIGRVIGEFTEALKMTPAERQLQRGLDDEEARFRLACICIKHIAEEGRRRRIMCDYH